MRKEKRGEKNEEKKGIEEEVKERERKLEERQRSASGAPGRRKDLRGVRV